MKKKYILSIGCALFLLSACQEDDLGQSDINIPAFNYESLSETDKYIYDTYTLPFNIEVLYKWNQGNVTQDDMSKNLVPPREELVVPFLQMIKAVWIDTYAAEVGAETLRQYIPKQLLLHGSHSYNDDGTTTEGTAEGGRQIVLYAVNDFTGSRQQVEDYTHVMHHEFAHILHQTVNYSPEFAKLTPSYSSTWNQMNDQMARSKGFITAYASSSADEDFAEMVSRMLTHSRDEWDALINGAGNAEAVAKLKEKEAIVIAYMKNSWGVDMYEFQERIMKTIDEISIN